MKLPALALFERSLRLESRSGLMCWSRVGLLAIILLFLVSVQSMAGIGFYGAPGLYFLEEMSWVNLIFITLAGVSYFASVITEEKEEMMLGLLRMTDLSPVAILLGKSTSRLFGALLLLVAQLPFVLLAVTLGGVGLVQILAAYSTLLAYLFLVCNMALLFSVMFRKTGNAAGVTLFCVFLFLVGHYWAAEIISEMQRSHGVNLQAGIWGFLAGIIQIWREASPPERFQHIFQTGFAGPIIGFQGIGDISAGVVFFLISWMVFDSCTRTEKEVSPARFWWWGRKSRGSRIPRGLVGFRAITWKDFIFISGGWLGLLIKFGIVGLLVGLWNGIVYWSDGRLTRELEGELVFWFSLLMTAFWLAIEASRIFSQEIRWKTLSSLATLPISVQELAYRKVAGALAGTLPLLAGCFLGALIAPDKVADFVSEMFRTASEVGAMCMVVMQFILFLHLTAFLSLIVKRGALALAFAIEYIGGYFLLGMAAVVLRFSGGPGALFFGVTLVCFALAAVLHFAIGVRLERAAAEA